LFLRYISVVPVSDLPCDAPLLDRKTSRLNWAYSYESFTATILPGLYGNSVTATATDPSNISYRGRASSGISFDLLYSILTLKER